MTKHTRPWYISALQALLIACLGPSAMETLPILPCCIWSALWLVAAIGFTWQAETIGREL